MTSDTLPEALERVYEKGYMEGDAPEANTTDPQVAAKSFHRAALLAVYRAGQKSVKPEEKDRA